MTNLNDMFNIVGPEAIESKPQKSIQDRVGGFQKKIQQMRNNITSANQPKLSDLVSDKLKSLTGYNDAQQSLVGKQAESAISGILNPERDPMQNIQQSPIDTNTVPAQDEGRQAIPSGAETVAEIEEFKNDAGQDLIIEDEDPNDGKEAGLISGDPIQSAKAKDDNLSLTAPAKAELQKKYLTAKQDSYKMQEVYNMMDPELLTASNKLKVYWLKKQSKYGDFAGMGELTPEEQKLVSRTTSLTQGIQTMALLWRKYITGVAGGEKEMEAIIAETLNKDMSPAEAIASRDRLFYQITRDMLVSRMLLQQGIVSNGKDDPQYTALFTKQRDIVSGKLNDHIIKFQERYPKASRSDAVMYYLHKNGIKK